MTARFSIVGELVEISRDPLDLPVELLNQWKAILKFMRILWEAEQDTLLETAFVYYFRKPSDPRRRWL